MEKPTGVIQKIIENLQQVNALITYSPIEKDIILHNLRAAYMIFLNITTDKQVSDVRIEKLFNDVETWRAASNTEEQDTLKPHFQEEISIDDEMLKEETIEEESIEVEFIEEESIDEEEQIVENVKIDEEQIENEPIEEKPTVDEMVQIGEEAIVEDEIIERLDDEMIEEEETSVEEFTVEKPHFEHATPVEDDILEFIPDAKPHSTLLFDDVVALKPEKKSLNDLLTEKKDDNSLGAKFQQSYIPDLTKAIAINEKFTFIRELFQNSGVNFSNSIQKLNECDNIESAFVLMEELKHQYLWDTSSSSYLSLCDLVRRRFV
ncbi:MAG: hypothetical protein LBI45_04010 [Bacteroidales bacterium]|jgi:hypothetical protein|nr:hypothetical protein [Bacteroidales bacterium]